MENLPHFGPFFVYTVFTSIQPYYINDSIHILYGSTPKVRDFLRV